MGKCPACGEWNTMQEETEVINAPAPAAPRAGTNPNFRSTPQRLREVNIEDNQRYPVPVEEFSRVLGGGIVPGSIVLIGGEPGIGKSTLLLQISILLAQSVGRVLYISGEESARQI